LKALPGVQAAAATDSLPLTDLSALTPVDVEGRPPIDFRTAKPGEVTPVSRPTVTLDYFNAMGIPLKNGRAFTSQDARPAAGVVIVNEAFEKHYFPGESAVGKRIRLWRFERLDAAPGRRWWGSSAMCGRADWRETSCRRCIARSWKTWEAL
jgi:putative ABC transport system permease protein